MYGVRNVFKNTGGNHSIRLANKSLVNIAKFRYFGMTVTNENYLQE
jgi:hypothetical protein